MISTLASMERVGALLFDLDGTLLDTAPEFTHCLNKLLQEEGKKQITLAGLRQVISFGVKGMIEFGFMLSEDDPQFARLKQRLLHIYSEDLGGKSELFPGVANILLELTTKKIPWGIVTNKSQVYTLPLVKKFNLLLNAHCVISGDSLSTQKPDPLPLLHACQALAVSPQHCWYVGDALTDVQASKSAGMRCAIANYGYIPQDENTLNWQADYYLSTAGEINTLLNFR